MKPVKLEIQAMGPYKNKEIIDFSTLGEKKFFLIHGPTGSGKTSILDAMTYALYGDTSGDERSLEQMRSQWADGNTESYVLFEFYIANKLYRIKRSPKQNLNKKKGEGTREVNQEAALWHVDNNSDFIITGASKVTEKIEDLLGFSSGQFRQVIVLPQGKFRELLASKGEGREEILKVLFATERFTDIQEMIKNRAGDVRRKLDDLSLERDAVLRGEGVESADELAAKASSFKTEAEGLGKKLKKLESEEKKLREEMKAAAVIEARFSERDMAQEALKILQAREDEIKKDSQLIEACRRARGLTDVYKGLSDERNICSGVEEKLKTALENLQSSEKAKKSAEKLINKIPERRDELSNIEKELYRFESTRTIYTELAKTDEEIELSEKLKSDSEKRFQVSVDKKRELDAGLQSVNKQLTEAEVAAAKIETLKLSLERITSAGKKIAEIEKATEVIRQLEKEIPQIEKKYSEVSAEAVKLGKLREDAEERWRRGQAAILASGLKIGEPCPVCGSLHHPAPADPDNIIPGKDQIEKLKSEEKSADGEARILEKEIIKKRAELESIKGQMPSADDLPEEYSALNRDDLKKKYRDESAELEKLSLKKTEAEHLKKKLPEYEKNYSEAVADEEKALSEIKNTEVALASLYSRREHLVTGIPEGINNLKELLERIASLSERSSEIRGYIKQSEDTWKESSEKFTAAETLYAKINEDYKSARERLSAGEAEFRRRLQNDGFESESEFSQLLAGSSNIKELEEGVEKYKRDLISAKGRFERAAAGIAEMNRPDIASISEKIESVRSGSDHLIGGLKGAQSEAIRLESIAARIKSIEKRASEEEESFSVMQKLADIANGRNSRRITFQRYVLQSLFDEVLMIASNRLERMSRGRYRLISPGKLHDRRASGGLDLEVFDEYTGYSRPVVTLSGGEAFLASLSLALGLADLVQQYSGGMQLDTVFIDEGFGSLDSETLDLAINTLLDLQSSGRLVGIISHVNELKERIDARLEVIPSGCGSTTRFVV
ncbi:MAG TPA: AAA family ATPase [Spirochaetota bacterium]|nr:AAA family ATPase [Spirochaetota bacterium]HPR38197.1 AAA family ATPase [Spirochaetota bacterium]